MLLFVHVLLLNANDLFIILLRSLNFSILHRSEPLIQLEVLSGAISLTAQIKLWMIFFKYSVVNVWKHKNAARFASNQKYFEMIFELLEFMTYTNRLIEIMNWEETHHFSSVSAV